MRSIQLIVVVLLHALLFSPEDGLAAGIRQKVPCTEPCKDEILDSILGNAENSFSAPLSFPRAETVACGDADNSGQVDIDDVVYLVTYIFISGPPPVPYECAGDADGSASVDIDDAVYLVEYVLAGGPSPIQTCCDFLNGWVSVGPFDGDGLTSLECNPTNSDTLYAGTNGHSGLPEGLYRSTDMGANWELLLADECNSLAIDPVNSCNIYAGMVNDLLRSTDGGISWDTLEAENLYPYFWYSKFISLTIDPVNPEILYACGADVFYGYFLFASYDGGDTWHMLLNHYENPGIKKLVIDALSPQDLYGAVSGAGIYKSTDAGDTWQWMNTGLTDLNISDIEIGTMSGTDSRSSVIYAATLGGGVFFSDDGAQKWFNRSTGLSSMNVSALDVFFQDAGVLYAGTDDGLFRSQDAGDIWTQTSELPPYHFNSLGEPIDSWVLGLSISRDNSNLLLVSRFDIVYRSPDGGGSWEFIGLPITQITAIEVHPNDPARLYCGARYGQGDFYESSNDGRDWIGWIPPEPGPYDVTAVRVHPDDPNSIYLSGYNMGGGFYRSYDCGDTWSEMNQGLVDMKDRCIEDFVLDPTNGDVIYLGTLNGVFKSTNGGLMWEATGLTVESIHVTSMATDPVLPDIIYAGTLSDGLFKSSDGGVGWTELDTGVPDAKYLAMTSDPGNPKTIYAGTIYDGVLKSTDSGDTWEQVNSGLGEGSIRTILVYNPSPDTNHIYIGSWGEGVYTSSNAGIQWELMNMEGMKVKKMTSLDYSFLPRGAFILFAGTYGGGVFTYTEGSP